MNSSSELGGNFRLIRRFKDALARCLIAEVERKGEWPKPFENKYGIPYTSFYHNHSALSLKVFWQMCRALSVSKRSMIRKGYELFKKEWTPLRDLTYAVRSLF